MGLRQGAPPLVPPVSDTSVNLTDGLVSAVRLDLAMHQVLAGTGARSQDGGAVLRGTQEESMRRTLGTERGQAAVETAIVMPLFVFMVLGLMQMTLLFQARAMLKYAAYRAVRAGALQNACVKKMDDAATAVMAPLMSATGTGYQKANDGTSYGQAYLQAVAANAAAGALGFKLIETRICGPLAPWLNNSGTFTPQNDRKEVDFDDDRNNDEMADLGGVGGSTGNQVEMVRAFSRLKLRVQVKFHAPMIIPFANYLIFEIWAGLRVADEVRMGTFNQGPRRNDQGAAGGGVPQAEDNSALLAVAMASHHYYLPMYANYAMRMQSNLFLGECPLPTENKCFHYHDPDTAGRAAGDP